MKLYVEGKLQTRSWEKDGQRRQKTEVIAENIQILYRPQEYLTSRDAKSEVDESAQDGYNEEQDTNEIF